MATGTDIPIVPPPNADLPLMLSSTPRPDTLVTALHPLFIIFILLYLLPGLFSDPTAQALVETCHLDAYIDAGF